MPEMGTTRQNFSASSDADDLITVWIEVGLVIFRSQSSRKANINVCFDNPLGYLRRS